MTDYFMFKIGQNRKDCTHTFENKQKIASIETAATNGKATVAVRKWNIFR